MRGWGSDLALVVMWKAAAVQGLLHVFVLDVINPHALLWNLGIFLF